jgi:hypothetical protein
MDETVRFLVFCMEVYKQHEHLTGAQVYAHFKKYHFDDYIVDLYPILHTQGTQFLMEELRAYQERQA